uniref:tryptase n=1 Tax=Sus scrofa TaxID=9823 RepID=I3L7Z2_PIG
MNKGEGEGKNPGLMDCNKPWRGCLVPISQISCKNVKGKLVEVGKWPWQVSILFLGMNICSGSLIHHQWVVTAAHCLERSPESLQDSTFDLIAGDLPPTHGPLSVTRVRIHEDFINLISQDIALLKLKDPISWSPLIQPVCLPSPKLKPSLGSMCWVIGWGQTDTQVTSKPSYRLQEVAVRIVNNKICNEQYKFLFLKDQKKLIGSDMICASAQWGTDTCQVNSGGSLVCQVNKTWIQMGVMSWSFICRQRRLPGIYTSISHFTDWIKRQVNDVRFVSGARPAFLSPVFLTGYILLVSLGSLWLL